jgi:hypothetical protein
MFKQIQTKSARVAIFTALGIAGLVALVFIVNRSGDSSPFTAQVASGGRRVAMNTFRTIVKPSCPVNAPYHPRTDLQTMKSFEGTNLSGVRAQATYFAGQAQNNLNYRNQNLHSMSCDSATAKANAHFENGQPDHCTSERESDCRNPSNLLCSVEQDFGYTRSGYVKYDVKCSVSCTCTQKFQPGSPDLKIVEMGKELTERCNGINGSISQFTKEDPGPNGNEVSIITKDTDANGADVAQGAVATHLTTYVAGWCTDNGISRDPTAGDTGGSSGDGGSGSGDEGSGSSDGGSSGDTGDSDGGSGESDGSSDDTGGSGSEDGYSDGSGGALEDDGSGGEEPGDMEEYDYDPSEY